jgi:regulator of protease activity HflC (stomatin/prohibitin superfamily)
VAAGVGVKVREVVVRDVILPIDIRRAATELVAAKAQGLAALEAARSESAALRSLANSAKLLDAHPALAQLRLVQAAPMGTRLVMALGGAEVPAGE